MNKALLKIIQYSLFLIPGTVIAASQPCSQGIIDKVGAYFSIDNFEQAQVGDSADDSHRISAMACKPMPNDKNIIISAIAYYNDEENFQNLVVTQYDKRAKKIVASYMGKIELDAAMQLYEDSLRIDTANYRLAKDIRAFGVDVNSSDPPNCGDGGFGAVRTLYIRNGRKIVPVMDSLYMETWVFLKRGEDRCTSAAEADDETVIESYDVTIGIGKSATNGLNDLNLTVTPERDDGRPSKKSIFRYTLKYDGHKYDLKKYETAYWKWR